MATFNVYRRVQGDTNAPVLIASGLTSKTYTDAVVAAGITYEYSVTAVRNGVEKLSEEKLIFAGKAWLPSRLLNKPKLWHGGDSATYDTSLKVSSLSNLSADVIQYNQSTPSKQPVLIDVRYGKAVKLDGSDDNFSTNIRNITNGASKAWIFFVGKIENTSNTQIVYSFLNSNGGSRFGVNVSTGKIVLNGRFGISGSLTNFVSQDIPSNEYFMCFLSVDFSSKVTKSSLNGNVVSTGSIALSGALENANSSANPILGSTIESTLYLGATICTSMLSFNAEPPLDELDKLFGWAAHKYGLTDNLPVDHRYKNSAPVL